MKPSTLSTALGGLLVTTFLASPEANAVRLDPEAGGQALIYPYYTVRSYGTDPFNTYISIVNTSADGKAVRVRFREGKAGLQTLGFNLFLSPNDTWTGALVPSADGGTQLITTDASCVSPAMPEVHSGVRGTSFSTFQFPANDLDRTREGYAEVLEMATLAGPTLAAITQDALGVPHNCAAVQSPAFFPPVADLAAPSGGLQGTLTLINVASGMDFTVNAEALADLTAAANYTSPSVLLPDFADPSIKPVSVITTPTGVYRLEWSSAIDAVSSVLMRDAVTNEYVLDTQTASSSDWIFTFPTRFHLVDAFAASPPFSSGPGVGCETLSFGYFNREAMGVPTPGVDFPEPPPAAPAPSACYAATVWSLTNFSNPTTPLFGSIDRTAIGSSAVAFQNGWARVGFSGSGPAQGLVSLDGSSRIDRRTGSVTTGRFRVQGLPVTGFFGRTFLNGLLNCSSGTCQGAYGSAFSTDLPVPSP